MTTYTMTAECSSKSYEETITHRHLTDQQVADMREVYRLAAPLGATLNITVTADVELFTVLAVIDGDDMNTWMQTHLTATDVPGFKGQVEERYPNSKIEYIELTEEL
jgi:hypothetical protein